MEGMAIATIGSAIIGGISSSNSSDKMADAQAKSDELTRAGMRQQAAAKGRQQMFDMQRYMDAQLEYDKLKAIYGPLQEDLGTYFTNLTGESLSNSEVIRIQEASQKSKDKIIQTMAQSGRANSGLEAELLANADFGSELAKAQARSTAEERAIAAKADFLNLGLTQQANSRTQLGNISNSISGNIYDPTQSLQNMGIGARNLATNQATLDMGYAKQLQGLLGYSAKNDVFNFQGSTNDMTFAPLTAAEQSSIALF